MGSLLTGDSTYYRAALQKFRVLTRRIVSTPKEKVEKRDAEWQQARKEKKRKAA